MIKMFFAFLLSLALTQPVLAGSKGRVLVVLSSEPQITLKNNVIHPTGFFLSELMQPVKALLNAGYTLEFANPKGTRPVLDKVSDSAFWFGDVPGASDKARAQAQADYQTTRAFCENLRLCGAPGSLVGTLTLERLSDIQDLSDFAGVFFPGGHAPMEDLWKDADVGRILTYFHTAHKPTALICHAPIALLSTLTHPELYINALTADDRAAMVKESSNWIYSGYQIAVFTTREEQQEETGGADNLLGGFVKFYPDSTLERAGAFVSRADKWKSNVVEDRELITGQNPFSDVRLAETLLNALERTHH